MYKKRSLATAENANALSFTPETTGSTASENNISQNNDVVKDSVRSDAKNDTDDMKFSAEETGGTGTDDNSKDNGGHNSKHDNIVGDVYVAFSPEQIKSATDNIGTFDGSNPDIRFSAEGSDVDTAKSAKENEKYSITESEDLSNEQSRSSILSGDSGRAIDESTGEQAGRVSSYKQKLEGKAKAKRSAAAKEIIDKGYAEEVVNGNHKYTLIKEDGYNDDMKSIVSEAKAYGKEVGFFIGNAVRKFDGKREIKIDGIKLSDDKILIRYDGMHTPQALFIHELVHTEWNNPEMQNAKDIILDDLSESEKNEILQNDRYKAYMKLYAGDEDAVWEEFIADVFANMNDYSDNYIDTAVDYWYNDNAIDRYNPGEYVKSIDAGGSKPILDNIGLSNESRLSEPYSLGNKNWHPDLSKKKLDTLKQIIKNDIKTSTKNITDTANWLFTNIDGIKVLAIYSTENVTEPTLLYESKGKQAELERKMLDLLLEDYEYGRSNVKQPKIVDTVFSSSWMRKGSGILDSVGTLGRGRSDRDATILQGKSKRKSNSAFKNVIRNIFETQRYNITDIKYSVEENDVSYLSEPIKNIRNDIDEVRLRAENSHRKVFDRKDINEIRDSILENISVGAVEGVEMRTKKDKVIMSTLVNRVLNSGGVDAKNTRQVKGKMNALKRGDP